MKYYPHPFSDEEVGNWIRWNIDNFEKYGFGLWAVILKSANELIEDCGITIQEVDGSRVPCIGYRIIKKLTRQGFAAEAARACKSFLLETIEMETVYSYTTYWDSTPDSSTVFAPTTR